MKPKPLSEKHIQETCSAFLSFDGWRRIKTDLPHLRGLGVQEPGMCDDLFLRYTAIPKWIEAPTDDLVALSETLWIEFKSRTGRAGEKQKEWQAKERTRGALVWVMLETFGASIEEFQEYYRRSGLMLRNLR